ncbi:MAG: glycoside hydrolase family 3 protein [Chloroflexi bacterium]|nr:MAG: glycoside hydrolase family 3 protein [Chloroflexota bacterium]
MQMEEIIGQKILLAFEGKGHLSADVLDAIRRYRPSGFTLFRSLNIVNPAQVQQLTSELQAAAIENGLPPFLIGVDQEGGQLMTIGEGVTQLPGNLALGATGSAELARQAGEVLGSELSAMGINVNYVPSCDVNINPLNPVIGTRSFGADPELVAEMAAAMVEGMQSRGVAAAAKHFPGHGDTAGDSHYSIPVVAHTEERLRSVELPPFAAAIRAGAKLVMSAHIALPAIDERENIPATLSERVLKGLLRQELGFEGVIVTDAMDMKAICQGDELGRDAVRAVKAGADLLLFTSDPADHRRGWEGLLQAGEQRDLDLTELQASVERILSLKRWLASQPSRPGLGVVGCSDHRRVADEIAARSVTLVRDHAKLLPVPTGSDHHLAVVLPQPIDLTPADTSSYVSHTLPEILRSHRVRLDDFLVPYNPGEGDISALLEQIRNGVYECVIVGTLNAFAAPGQAALVKAMVGTGIPTIIAAMRLPYDLSAFPEVTTFLCTYSLLEPSMRALARVLVGEAEAMGKLPVSIPGIPV